MDFSTNNLIILYSFFNCKFILESQEKGQDNFILCGEEDNFHESEKRKAKILYLEKNKKKIFKCKFRIINFPKIGRIAYYLKIELLEKKEKEEVELSEPYLLLPNFSFKIEPSILRFIPDVEVLNNTNPKNMKNFIHLENYFVDGGRRLSLHCPDEDRRSNTFSVFSESPTNSPAYFI